MSGADLELGLALAAILFVIGLAGMIARRSMLFMLLCAEIMLNAAGFAFIVAGARWGRPEGQAMFIFLLVTAAAEVAIGLALILTLSGPGRGEIKDLDADQIRSGGA
jgi:NADH-quinone oxidoreductase subunit K